MDAEKCLADLRAYFRETSLLETTMAVLEWDERTGMPVQAGDFRADQVTLLSGLVHQRRTSDQIGEWLGELQQSDWASDPNSQIGATIRCAFRDWNRQRKLPMDLVQRMARATVRGQQVWAASRPSSDWNRFSPLLAEIIQLRKEEAALLREPNGTAYDALLDQYEEGANSNDIAVVFADLRQQLVPLVAELKSAPNRPDGKILNQKYDITGQRELSRFAAKAIGYSFERGRLDETDHPFCTTLGPDDCRILTRYQGDFFNSGFFGTLHEAGHGLYEQGLPADWFGLPPGAAVSLGIHESQSRMWENMVGRSRPFWVWCLPYAEKIFPSQLGAVGLDEFYNDINLVQPSLIRVEADEATYNLHILIRFELEREIFDGNLAVADLPEAWDSRYEEYLGIRPPAHRDGILQDVHWSAGLFGYFPTYTLGNLYAAQLFAAADEDLGGIEILLANGDFQPLLEWLKEKIHRHGRCYQPAQLIQNATGKPLSAEPLLEYLRNKLEVVHGLV